MISSLQWRDLAKRLLLAREFPVLAELILMDGGPLEHKLLDTLRERSLYDTDRINANHRLVLTVTSVKVRRIMIAVQHADNDAEELRDPWHVVMIAEVAVVGGAVSDSA